MTDKEILDQLLLSLQNTRKAVQELPLFVPCCGPDRHEPSLFHIDQAIAFVYLLMQSEVDTVSTLETKLGLIHHAAEIALGAPITPEDEFLTQMMFILAESEE